MPAAFAVIWPSFGACSLAWCLALPVQAGSSAQRPGPAAVASVREGAVQDDDQVEQKDLIDVLRHALRKPPPITHDPVDQRRTVFLWMPVVGAKPTTGSASVPGRQWNSRSGMSTAAGPGVSLTLDTRDNQNSSTRGWFAAATYRAHLKGFLGGDSDWHRLSLDLRRYVPLPGRFGCDGSHGVYVGLADAF